MKAMVIPLIIRRLARCTKCGRKGAALQHWYDGGRY
jgi:hypothetical protein